MTIANNSAYVQTESFKFTFTSVTVQLAHAAAEYIAH